VLRRADHSHTADKLEAAVAAGLDLVTLTIAEHDAILSVLVDPPPGLEQLRAVLCPGARAWR